MTLREHLEAVVQALPDGALVSLPVDALRAWLAEDGVTTNGRAGKLSGADLTVERLADCLGVGLSRARDIVRAHQEELGAYRRGRRWYVPEAGLLAWQCAQAAVYRGSRARDMDGADVDDFEALRKELSGDCEA